MITSTQNPKIQWLRRLQSQASERREENAFPIEGVRLAEEALASGWRARLVIYSEELSERGLEVVAGFRDQQAPVELVSPEVLAAASDTKTPQGLVLALERTQSAAPDPISISFSSPTRSTIRAI